MEFVNPTAHGPTLLAAPARAHWGFTRIVRLILAAGMIGQAQVLLLLDQRLRISSHVSGDGVLGHWPLLWLFSLAAAAALIVSAAFPARSPVGKALAAAGCVLAWTYYAVLQPWWYFAGQLAGSAFFIPACVLLSVSALVFRDACLLARFVALEVADVIAPLPAAKARPSSFPEFTRQLEASPRFIPGIYLLQGIFLLILPLLFPLESSGPYLGNLSHAASGSSQNYIYLPALAGALLLAASLARRSNGHLSGAFALQSSVIALWFGTILLLGLPPVFYRSGPMTAHHYPSLLHLALTIGAIIPMFFTAAWAVRDLAWEERLAAVFQRLAAGCSFLALLPSLHWELHHIGEPPSPSGAFLGLIAASYVFVAFYPVPLRKIAIAIAIGATSSILMVVGTGLLLILLILPDFSGGSGSSRHRPEILIIFFTNLCLAAATAAVVISPPVDRSNAVPKS
jgi:hypothetical protein